MTPTIPEKMKAAAIDRFGGPEVLHTETLPVPKPGAGEILIRLEAAGVGVWDPEIREGGFDDGNTRFPAVIGNDGAGTVVAAGSSVRRFKPGDRVYAYEMKGGFYAEYVSVKEDDAAPIPRGLSAQEAGALGADGITALRGLEDELHLGAGQAVLIFGASGGIGHIAVQIAKRMGARVFAVASGHDGVELVRRLGADAVADGRADDAVKLAKEFAPDGFDAALVLAGGRGVDDLLKSAMKKQARVAHPNGVEPEPKAAAGVTVLPFDGVPSADAFARLNQWIAAGPFHVELGRVYSLDDAAQAHRDVAKHHIGKLALKLH